MNEIDLNEILKVASDFWPKTTSSELGLLQKVVRQKSFETVKDAIEAVRLKRDYKTLPLADIKTKIAESKRSFNNDEDNSYDQNWKDCYFVCVESDGTNKHYYPGRMKTVAFSNKGWTNEDFVRMMSKEVHCWRERYGAGMCRFEFFIGKESFIAAQKRASDLFKEAFNQDILPARFYKKTSMFGETHETQPGEVPRETKFAEFDPDNPDELPF